MSLNKRRAYRSVYAFADFSIYENTTNMPGAKFLASNLWCGPIRLYVKLDTLGDSEHPVARKQIEIHWLLRIRRRYRSLRFKAAW